MGNRWLWSVYDFLSLLLPLSLFLISIVGPLHGLQSFRINFLQHWSSMGHRVDIYCGLTVSTGCSEIPACIHRLKFLSGEPALAWALDRWQFIQEISTCSDVRPSTSCSMDICCGGWAEGKYLLWSLQHRHTLSGVTQPTGIGCLGSSWTPLLTETILAAHPHVNLAIYSQNALYGQLYQVSTQHSQWGL